MVPSRWESLTLRGWDTSIGGYQLKLQGLRHLCRINAFSKDQKSKWLQLGLNQRPLDSWPKNFDLWAMRSNQILWSNIFFHSFTDFPGRPHSLKIFMQTHAGNQNGRQLFINKILPMFKGASMSVDFLGMLQLLSSLFTGDQCLWLLLVTLAHELSSPRSYTQSFVLYHILIWKIWKLSWLHHQQN